VGYPFCHFYETPKRPSRHLDPYFKAGLENNELCMWIVCDPIAEADGHRALRNAVPEFDRRLAAGDIEIVPHFAVVFQGGCLRWTAGNRRLEGKAGSGAGGWLRRNAGKRQHGMGHRGDWTDFARCECEFTRTIAPERMLLLCAYPLPSAERSRSL